MKYCKIISGLILFSLCSNINAQTFIKSDFIGTWAVDSVGFIKMQRPISKTLIGEMEQLKTRFQKSFFVFNADGGFSLLTTEKHSAIQSAIWEVNDENNVTIIRIWKNKDKGERELLIILPNKNYEKVNFCISDTIIKLFLNKHL